jgi:hypothetical protein
MSYLTVEEAQVIVNARMNTESWDTASYADKTKALNKASEMVDNLSYIGERYLSTQEHAFPRGSVDVVPVPILKSIVVLAIALLDGMNPDNEANNVTISSQRIGIAGTTYDRSFVPEYLSTGIPCAEAFNFLKPYLRDSASLNMIRVN